MEKGNPGHQLSNVRPTAGPYEAAEGPGDAHSVIVLALAAQALKPDRTFGAQATAVGRLLDRYGWKIARWDGTELHNGGLPTEVWEP